MQDAERPGGVLTQELGTIKSVRARNASLAPMLRVGIHLRTLLHPREVDAKRYGQHGAGQQYQHQHTTLDS